MTEAALALAALSIALSGVSLALHWVRGREHPDVSQLRTEQLDLLDRVEHWMKRDRVRRLRDSAPDLEQLPLSQMTPPADRKAALRERLRHMNAGGSQ